MKMNFEGNQQMPKPELLGSETASLSRDGQTVTIEGNGRSMSYAYNVNGQIQETVGDDRNNVNKNTLTRWKQYAEMMLAELDATSEKAA